ncbi:NYN domain, limkain-b1-type [Kalmanozyma brasiliensis GHG001]|uniref:NYN domain-containing protein n=1 Tax=Kalmanozyma brasiliensis (strain GHG001) TaxID=1365824 RepID=V5E826_KALBG|nr:NYN domain, limkain-b1-type [Kalmanozyma brasiliensis GHG001]EST06471.1 NYN domain, limkain-b1-type [Kalmanozyma brasiliensis GHG001]
MASNRQDAAASASIGTIANFFQQPGARWLALAGLGTGSLLLATRFFPRPLPKGKDTASTDRDDGQRESSPPAAANGKAKRERFKEDVEPIAIFWDVDNCAPPTGSSGRSVALAVRTAIQGLNVGPIVSFKAYLELSSETQAPNAAQVQLRSELQGCGVSLIDTPKSGRKDVADKMMITDCLSFAIDQAAPATVVLISGDRDFAYPLGILRNRGYNVVLVTPPIGAPPILEASANVVMSWRQDVLGVQTNKDGKLYSTYSNAGPHTPSKQAHSHTAAGHAPSTSTHNGSSVPKPPGALAHQDRRPSNRTVQLFGPLIKLLEQIKKEGNSKPLRSAVAARLVQQDRSIFLNAGAAKWAEYAAVAEAAGIVTLGSNGQAGYEWVSLKDSAKTAASSTLMTPTTSASTPTRQKSYSHNATATPSYNPSDTAARLKPFLPLIEICKEQRSQNVARPLCSYVGMQLSALARQGIVDAYALAGVPGWKEYLAAAEKAGIARPAPTDQEGVLVVELHPKYYNWQTNQILPSANRIADTATTPSPSVDKKTSPFKRAISDLSFKSTPKTDTTQLSKQRTIVNGHEIPLAFSPLATLLFEQMLEGRNYSTDYFCQSIVASGRTSVVVPELKVRTAEEFAEHLEAAVAAKIVTTEPGFKPGVRHVRLHPRLVKMGGKTSVTDDEGSDGEASLGNEAQDLAALREQTSQVLADLQRSTSSEGYTASGPVPADDGVRFRPLLDSLLALSAEGSAVTKTKLSSEVGKRNPGPAGIGAFYQSLGSTGFTDYLQQAREKGLVKALDAEGQVVKGGSLIGLSDYTVAVSL